MVKQLMMEKNLKFELVDYKKACIYLSIFGEKNHLENVGIKRTAQLLKGKRESLITVGSDVSI